jgi:hypothetical protein
VFGPPGDGDPFPATVEAAPWTARHIRMATTRSDSTGSAASFAIHASAAPGSMPAAHASRALSRSSAAAANAFSSARAAGSGSRASRSSAVARVQRFGLFSADTAPSMLSRSTGGTLHFEPTDASR